MDEDKANEILRSGSAEDWKQWCAENPAGVSFSRPNWYDCPGPGGRQMKGRNRIDFSGYELRGISAYGAFAEGLQMRNAIVEDCHFEEGDFSRANFSGTTFRNTRFNKTIMTGATFTDATFINCNLNRVNLAEADFQVREIRDTIIYGLSAWDLTVGEDTKQSNLVIEKSYELYSDLVERGIVPLSVDDIEIAQFVYYLSNHKKLRNTLNVLNEKGVLLLGGFRDGGLERLYKLRDWFRERGYTAMIFDFARPDNLSLTETVVTMGGLAKFIVADLTGPSVPHELASVLAQIKKPVIAYGDPYAMFPDLADQTRLVAIDGDTDPMVGLESALPEAEAFHAARMVELAARYTKADRKRLGES